MWVVVRCACGRHCMYLFVDVIDLFFDILLILLMLTRLFVGRIRGSTRSDNDARDNDHCSWPLSTIYSQLYLDQTHATRSLLFDASDEDDARSVHMQVRNGRKERKGTHWRKWPNSQNARREAASILGLRALLALRRMETRLYAPWHRSLSQPTAYYTGWRIKRDDFVLMLVTLEILIRSAPNCMGTFYAPPCRHPVVTRDVIRRKTLDEIR